MVRTTSLLPGGLRHQTVGLASGSTVPLRLGGASASFAPGLRLPFFAHLLVGRSSLPCSGLTAFRPSGLPASPPAVAGPA